MDVDVAYGEDVDNKKSPQRWERRSVSPHSMFDIAVQEVYCPPTMEKTQQELQQQQTALFHKRQAAASRLQHFNAIKDGLEADERIERSVDLIDSLNKIDEQLEDIQFQISLKL